MSPKQIEILKKFRKNLAFGLGNHNYLARQFVQENPETVKKALDSLDRLIAGENNQEGYQTVGMVLNHSAIGVIKNLANLTW